jgi:hypothetical protein
MGGCPCGSHGIFHHFSPTGGMDIKHDHAEIHGGNRRCGNRIGNIMELEIKKNLTAFAPYSPNDVGPMVGKGLFADFKKTHMILEAINPRDGVLDLPSIIKGKDEPFFGIVIQDIPHLQ